ncbi:MliC family protein [Parvularcula dongshanensis]|uniref:Putative membrane protein n=1 Tax=Parvularcula dongshanensis TaxID=1173995 RepID=A0A840I282_9PROT|nr:MliC family protein [Parvularcula dongshanensis]MBB4658170.1 putative membrane protein [Parvularcula dongshanensis]
MKSRLVLSLLAACATSNAASAEAPERYVVMSCPEGAAFGAAVGSEAVRLDMPSGGSVPLRRTRTASGARYTDEGGTVLWTHGAEARIEQPAAPPMTCEVGLSRPLGAPDVEDGYIARGQEPGWIARFAPDHVAVTAAYGTERFVLPRMPAISDEHRLLYRGEEEEDVEVSVTLGRLCTDAMNGAAYPDTVTLRIGGETYSGCGGPEGGLPPA